MSLKNMEKDDKNLVSLSMTIAADDFSDATAKVFKRDAMKYNIPGFRRGKAPRGMVERVYGQEVFYDGAVNLLIPDIYERTVEENGLEPVEKPDIEVLKIGPEGVEFVARVHVYPEAEVGEYKGLRVYSPPVEVDASDIDIELSRLQERNARLVTVLRPAQKTDTVTLDYEGFIDDIPFEGGKAENQQLEIGKGAFVPGFEEQIVGKVTGDECRVTVTFPEDYQAPNLAGREATFHVTVHEVKEQELPALDDEFAKDVSSFDTLEELRRSIMEKLEKERAAGSERTFENALNEQLIGTTTVEIPESMVTDLQAHMLQDFSRSMSAQGMDFETFVRLSGREPQDFLDDLFARARRQLTLHLGLEKIAALEGLEISDEEIQAEYTRSAEKNNLDVEQIKRAIAEKDVRRDLLRVRAYDLVKKHVIVEKEPREEIIIPNVKKTEEVSQ